MVSDDNSDHSNRNLTRPNSNRPMRRRYRTLNELITNQNRIERDVQHMTSIAQRWRQNADDGLRSLIDSIHHTPLVEQRGRKRDNSHLVEEALETNSEVKKPDTEEEGSFFDCSICLELAKEPILTCCGHLFCWACFYQVSNIDSSSKECPVCKGEVSDSTVTPIYGNGDSKGIRITESGLLIPPRPKGRRVERVRQQQRLSHTPISDALRPSLIRNSPTGDGEASPQTGERHSARVHWALRVISENPTTLPFLSSAFSNDERLFDVRSDSPTAPTSSFILRRNVGSRNSDVDTRDQREPRRRRLN